MIVRSFGSLEIEPNNTLPQANGPLLSGLDYHGYEDDVSDYFHLFAVGGGNISVDLSNTSATGTQLYLYYQNTSDLVDHDGHIGAGPYHVGVTGAAAGLYYVRITAGAPFNSAMPYTLRLEYP
jgi:hypothetical protein